ncbi:uncharacterized protein LOC123220109 isoform X2 [Mangifera indica]|uniref:uncharacterized protein LOC123220109 isoform X2 n=1 Tax=Mangifera indica TaxID=29780 RepID=UPI001CF99231|nr:uncharacterized protein LOC123220109 isoform X2 [Mangifera indica]
MGGGTFVPTKSIGEDEPLAVEYFNFSSSIADHLTSASLVIGHAGDHEHFFLFKFLMHWQDICRHECLTFLIVSVMRFREHIRDLATVLTFNCGG